MMRFIAVTISSFERGAGRGLDSKSTTIRTSAAIASFLVANTGLRSSSTISGKSLTSRDTLTMTSASAARSMGSPPRTPFSMSWAWMPSSIDNASSLVAGARRKVMSFSTSTSTPPRPKGRSLPTEPSGMEADDDVGAPRQHLLDLNAFDLGVGFVFPGIGQNGRVILFDVGGGVHAHHHAAGLGLVQAVGRD